MAELSIWNDLVPAGLMVCLALWVAYALGWKHAMRRAGLWPK